MPPEKTRCPFYWRLGGPQGRSGLVRKISPQLGFDPRTVQPVASRYTECAIPTLDLALWYPYFYSSRKQQPTSLSAVTWLGIIDFGSPLSTFKFLRHLQRLQCRRSELFLATSPIYNDVIVFYTHPMCPRPSILNHSHLVVVRNNATLLMQNKNSI